MPSPFDEIAQKRLENSDNRGVLETREAITQGAKSADIHGLLGPLQDLGEVFKSQPDLRPDIKELNTQLLEGIKGLDNSESHAMHMEMMQNLVDTIKQQEKSFTNSNKELKQAVNQVFEAIKTIEVAPIVNVPAPIVNVPKASVTVPAPKVTVEAPKVDLTEVSKAIKDIKIPDIPAPTVLAPTEDPKIDLDDYKAQDIDNSHKNTQYIGFLNPNGDWYIIENDVKGDKLRYVFGTGNYLEAFNNAGSYEYKLLNEAINAVPA